MNAKVSVVVPVYNVEKYLPRCVESILKQTLKEIELILVDDGTPDMGGKMCDEYAQRDNRVKVIHKINGGVSAARNDGLKIATGDYIAFVDSDDYISNEMLEKMYCQAVENDAEMAMCDFEYTNGEEVDLFEKDTPKKQGMSKVLGIKDAFKILADFDRNVQVSVWNKIFKREILAQCYFDENKKMSEDLEFLMMALMKCKKVVYIQESLYGYYVQRVGAATFHGSNDIDWYLLQNSYITSIMDRVIEANKDLKNMAIGYKSVNGNLSVANAMVRQQCGDKKIIRKVRKELRENLIYIIKSELYFLKKVQIIVFLMNYRLYSCLMKKKFSD